MCFLLCKKGVGEGTVHSHWEKLRRLARERLIPGRSSVSGKQGGRRPRPPPRRGSLPSARLLSTPRTSSSLSVPKSPVPCCRANVNASRGYDVCQQSGAFWEEGFHHSAPSVCSSVVIGKDWDRDRKTRSSKNLNNFCPFFIF